MTDVQWITTFIVSLLVKLVFTPLPRNAENRQIIFMSSIALIVSGSILLAYGASPPQYERIQVDEKTIIIFKGSQEEQQTIPQYEYRENPYYLGGLIKKTL